MPLLAPEMASLAGRPGRAIEALESTRRAMGRYRMAMAWTGAVLVGLAVAAALIVADLSWVLPFGVRAVGLLVLVGSIAAFALKSFIPKAGRFGKGEAAAEVESSFPELGQRLRTTLEYVEPTPQTAPALPGLVRALASETDRQSDLFSFPAVVPWGLWRRRGFVLGLVVVGGSVGLASDPSLRIAARRLLLLPGHYTTLMVEPGDQTLTEGSEFKLRASFQGRPVASAAWLTRPAGTTGPWTTTPLARADQRQALSGLIEASRKDCRADFEYRVVAGEVESSTYRVRVTHPLNLKSFEAAIAPPGYTRLKPSVVKEADFRVPAGSKVGFRIVLDRAPTSASISWTVVGSASPTLLPLAIEGPNLSGELPPLSADVRYELIAVAADRMELEPAKHLIQVKADEPPTIRFVKPAESLAVTPTTEVAVKVVATDDFGVRKLGVSYRIGNGPEESLLVNESAAPTLSVETLATLYLEKHPLTFADSLSYQGFVEDNREPGPQRVRTELRFIDILPYKQEYQVVDGGGSSDGSSVTLEELILRQRQALNRTLAHQDDRPVARDLAERLVKEETEIATATRAFYEALAAAVGFVPALEQATLAMDEATTSLASGSFAEAVAPERAALTALTKARQNLRTFLKNSPTASNCRKVDRQQREPSIRKPPIDPSRQAELAKLEPDLKKLAQAQRQFAEDIQPKATVEAKLDRPANSKTPPASSPGDRQAGSVNEAERLKAVAERDPALTELARSRMSEAMAQVKGAEVANREGRLDQAASDALESAGQLERLSREVAGLKANDLAGQLAKARDLARETAKAGREPAAEPRGLAEDARSLAELIQRAESQASEEDRAVASALTRAASVNSPTTIEETLRQAGSSPTDPSNRALARASDQLEALARDLETARREFIQPKLRQLIAAERRTAEVRNVLESVSNESKKAEAEKALADLARALGGLKPGEGPLQEASEALAKVAQSGSTSAWTGPARGSLKEGLFLAPIDYTDAVQNVAKALQSRIQELVRAEALVDGDGPVPPVYEDKVQDYFRLLSEDLR